MTAADQAQPHRYRTIRSDRKTLEIAVHPDRSVVVRAPRSASDAEIAHRVRRRAAWIRKHQDFFIGFEPRTPPRRYVNGETHLYLGRRYRLKIQIGKAPCTRMRGGHLLVTVPDPANVELVRATVDAWYAERAHAQLRARFESCCTRYQRGGTTPTLQIRRMSKRWGSLSAQNRLTLNVALIHAPTPCIDYVIVHELCHLRHRNHARKFWTALDTALPDWRGRKDRLEALLV